MWGLFHRRGVEVNSERPIALSIQASVIQMEPGSPKAVLLVLGSGPMTLSLVLDPKIANEVAERLLEGAGIAESGLVLPEGPAPPGNGKIQG